MASYVGKPTDLLGSGPLVAVQLCAPQHVKTTLAPIDTYAEINTGVANTYIQEGVATSLGLQPIATIKITTATRPGYESFKYRIRLVFPEAGKALEVTVIEVPYMPCPNVRIKCVIGRDILQLGVLTYDGRGNTFSFDF